MVRELGHHYVSLQSCSRDAFVDHLAGDRRLDQRFTLGADPFLAHMLLNGEHVRCVVQLLANVFAHALKLTVARALGVVGFVMITVRGNCAKKGTRLGLAALAR